MSLQTAISPDTEALAGRSILLAASGDIQLRPAEMFGAGLRPVSLAPKDALHLVLSSRSRDENLAFILVGRASDDRMLQLAEVLNSRDIPFMMVFAQMPPTAEAVFRFSAREYAILQVPGEEIRESVARFIRSLGRTPTVAAQRQKRRQLRVKYRNIERIIGYDDIVAISVSGDYVEILQRSSVFVLRDTISRIEARLDPLEFIRIHRSYLVPCDRIVQIEVAGPKMRNVRLNSGNCLPIGRTYWPRVKARFLESHHGAIVI
jgi:DNA-binding LytR/AlgR family response regulator